MRISFFYHEFMVLCAQAKHYEIFHWHTICYLTRITLVTILFSNLTMKHTRDQLIEALFENMNSVKRGFYWRMHNLTRDVAISGTQLELLFIPGHNQPVSSKQLAELLHMTPGAVSQLADSLEQQELIERQTSEQDRRVQYLRVSEKGEEFIRSFEKSRHKVMEAVIKDLSDEELEVWLRVQQKMIAYFKSEATE